MEPEETTQGICVPRSYLRTFLHAALFTPNPLFFNSLPGEKLSFRAQIRIHLREKAFTDHPPPKVRDAAFL